MNSTPPRPPRRRRLLIVATVAAVLVLAATAWGLPALVAGAVRALAEQNGLSLELEGLALGTTIEAERLSVFLPGDPDPILEARSLNVTPQWMACLRGRWFLAEVFIDSVHVRVDERLVEWIQSRPKVQAERSPDWRIDAITIPRWSAAFYGVTASGEVRIAGVTGERVESGAITASTTDGVSAVALAADGRVTLEAKGERVPAVLASLPGLEQAETASWTLLVSALQAPEARPVTRADTRNLSDTTPDDARTDTRSLAPDWFQAILDRRVTVRGGIHGDRRELATLLLQAEPESRGLRFRAEAENRLVVSGGSSLTGDALSTTLDYTARPAKDATLSGRLHLDLVVQDRLRVRQGSSWTITRGAIAGMGLPEGMVTFSGDRDSGYRIVSAGSLGNWRALLVPDERKVEWSGELRIDRLGPVSGLRLRGEAEGALDRGTARWSVTADAEGHVVLGARTFTAGLSGAASGRGGAWRATLRRIALEERGGGMALHLANLVASGSPGDWALANEAAGTLFVSGRRHELRVSARGGPGIVEVTGARIGGIAFSARAEFPGGRYAGTSFTIPTTPLAAVGALAPPAHGAILERSRLEGSIAASFRHGADRRVHGVLDLRVDRFTDPVSGFLVEGFRAEIPIRQRFVSPGELRPITAEERWPDVPVNVFAGRIARGGIEVSGLQGRAVFSDYVFRMRDLTFGILGGRARSRFLFDPFRSPEGRWRAALELTIDRLPLRNLYEGFVGRGSVARGITGEITVDLETAWSDTECLEGRGVIASTGGGKVGRRVIQALVGMMPREKRPPALALALLGDYDYDSFAVRLERTASIDDFLTRVQLLAERETLLGELDLEVPLLRLLQGLPVEVERDIGMTRRESR